MTSSLDLHDSINDLLARFATEDAADHSEKNAMDVDRGDLIRIGVMWHHEEYTLFWVNSENPPSVDEVVSFVYRHPGVRLELFEQEISPLEFAQDWEMKRQEWLERTLPQPIPNDALEEADPEKPSVVVLMPTDWEELCALKSIAALLFKARRVRKRDVYAVGWQTDERDILEVVMRTEGGAKRLVKWIDDQRNEGVWDAFTQKR